MLLQNSVMRQNVIKSEFLTCLGVSLWAMEVFSPNGAQ